MRAVAIMAALALVGCSSAASVAQMDGPKAAGAGAVAVPPAVNSVEFISIGGIEHRVYLRGQYQHLPVLLVVHGGPGDPSSQGAHRWSDALINQFIVVHYDQRGSGGTKSADPATINASQLQKDLEALVETLCGRFNVQRVTLLGHDFGGTLALRTAAANPDRFWSVVAVSPVVNGHESEAIGYAFQIRQAKAADDFQTLRALEKIGEPPWRDRPEARRTALNWLARSGGVLYGQRSTAQLAIIRAGAQPAYRLEPAVFSAGIARSEVALRASIIGTALIKEVRSIQVPIFLLTGRLDYVTPAQLLRAFYVEVSAPRGKNFVWMDSSAHFGHLENPSQLLKLLREDVLALIERRPPQP
jgi:pimeloyl-ACP methyl ester carboxylesterase